MIMKFTTAPRVYLERGRRANKMAATSRAHKMAAPTALLLLLALTAAQDPPRRLNVSDALKSAICPFQIVTDHDPERVPPYIRTMQCTGLQLDICRTGVARPALCCAGFEGGYYFECAELRETVVVRYQGRDQDSTYEVPVGCACKMGEVMNAVDLPSGSG